MRVKSLSLTIPDTKPYDKQANWFQSFIGNGLMDIIDSGKLSRFWFTCYGAVGHEDTKHIMFRFETSDESEVDPYIQTLQSTFVPGPAGYTDYDVATDIGKGQGSRFLGSNAKHQDHARRGNIAFSFLHASALLFLDCLVGPDEEGYWNLESETQSGFNKETPLEQYHHLFCNMTQVPTYVTIGMPPGSSDVVPFTYEEFKHLSHKPGWRWGNLRNGHF